MSYWYQMKIKKFRKNTVTLVDGAEINIQGKLLIFWFDFAYFT